MASNPIANAQKQRAQEIRTNGDAENDEFSCHEDAPFERACSRAMHRSCRSKTKGKTRAKRRRSCDLARSEIGIMQRCTMGSSSRSGSFLGSQTYEITRCI